MSDQGRLDRHRSAGWARESPCSAALTAPVAMPSLTTITVQPSTLVYDKKIERSPKYFGNRERDRHPAPWQRKHDGIVRLTLFEMGQ
jgi:hypothetical protein